MGKKDHSKSDNRAYLISALASIFTVIIITAIDILIDFLNAYDCKITPFLGKIAIIGVLIVVFFGIKNQYDKDHRIR